MMVSVWPRSGPIHIGALSLGLAVPKANLDSRDIGMANRSGVYFWSGRTCLKRRRLRLAGAVLENGGDALLRAGYALQRIRCADKLHTRTGGGRAIRAHGAHRGRPRLCRDPSGLDALHATQ